MFVVAVTVNVSIAEDPAPTTVLFTVVVAHDLPTVAVTSFDVATVADPFTTRAL